MIDTPLLISISVFIAIAMFCIGIFFYASDHKERWTLIKRIKQIEEGVRPEENTNALFEMKNYLLKIVGSLGNLAKPKSEGEISHLRKMFLKAGYRKENALVIFFGFKAFLAILLPAIFSMVKLLIIKAVPSLYLMLFSILLAAVGFYLPNLWLQMRISSRKDKIQKGFPDALDLMVACVEAGIGLDAAISRVGEEMRWSNKVLSEELRLLILELRAGKQRRDALKNLVLRTDLEDVGSLVTLLIQTERFGTSIAQALRVHSDAMRTKRFQRAEEAAAKLPVKLVFPLILFIFPSLFVVILGPAAIRIFRILLPHLGGQ